MRVRRAYNAGHASAQGPGTSGPFLDAFRRGLAETGHVEGQNVAIEYRLTGGQLDRLPALAADLVRLQVSVIATSGSTAAVAARAATRTIPIAFSVPEDPVKLGLVASLARPGGNATGINFLSTEVTTKRMGLLRAGAHGCSGCGADQSKQPREYVGHAH